MVRPLKADRASLAITHVRISKQTKQLLEELKAKHQLTTIDQVLRYYLPSSVNDNRPIFHSAKEVYDLTKSNREIDRLIKDTSEQIMRKINKDGPSHPKNKPANKKSLWQQQRKF